MAAEASLAADLSSQISTEHAHHVSAEGSIDTRLTAEESTRLAADISLEDYVDAEIVAANASIDARVSREEDERLAVDTSLETAITAEASSRVVGDASLATAIDAEKGRIDAILAGADVDLDQFVEIVDFVNAIDLENDNALLSAVTSIGTAIDTEASSRLAGDDSLETALGNAEFSINSAMTAEASSRVAGDGSLETSLNEAKTSINNAIANEESLRTSADASLEVFVGEVEEGLMSQLSSETSRAMAAEESIEEALAAEVANLIANTDLTAIDSFSEVVAELGAITEEFNNTYFKKVTVSGLVDGENQDFTLAFEVRPNSEAIYYNGLLQEAGVDYNITGVNVNFNYMPAAGGKVTAYGVYA